MDLGYFPYNYYGAAEYYFRQIIDRTAEDDEWVDALYEELESEASFALLYTRLLNKFLMRRISKQEFDKAVSQALKQIKRPWSELVLSEFPITQEVLAFIKVAMFVSDEGRRYVHEKIFLKHYPPNWLWVPSRYVVPYPKTDFWG